MKAVLSGLLLVAGPLAWAVAQKPAPPEPPVTITLGPRHGHVTPVREGCTHTGGGNIDVAQPTPDVVVVTMTGVAVAYGSPAGAAFAGLDFDLEQCLEVEFAKGVKAAKVTGEGRVIGLLRSHAKGGGSAEESGGCATLALCEPAAGVLTLCVPAHSVAGGENLSINDRDGPVTAPIIAGKYVLHQKWHVAAAMPKRILPCKAPSAEFAPDPALDPLWISYWEPFHGANKKDFGFQVTIKVAPEEAAGGNATDKGEQAPAPKKAD
jgi:hypothetical protein